MAVHSLSPNNTGVEKRKSIAFVVNNYPPKVGGVELHVSALADHLAARGHRVTVISLDNEQKSRQEDGVRVIRLKGTSSVGGVLAFPRPGAARRIRAVLREVDADLVSTHTRFFPMSYLGVRAARRLAIPAMHTEHGSDFVRGVSPLVSTASRAIDWTMGRTVLRSAGTVLAISGASREFVRRLANVDARVFHNAIDAGFFSAGAPTAPALPNHLVYVGRVVAGKGWPRVLEVAEALHPSRPDLHVHFIGDGVQRPLLEQAVASATHPDRFTVHGYMDGEGIRGILAGGVLLNPTELAEGFQTTLLEAVAAGAAVISTPVAAAEYLRGEGASVETVAASDSQAWVEATERALARPLEAVSDHLLESMDWTGRTDDFLREAASVIARRRWK